jgi:hypothetical protein
MAAGKNRIKPKTEMSVPKISNMGRKSINFQKSEKSALTL